MKFKMTVIVTSTIIYISLVFAYLAVPSLSENCDELGILFYEDLGCTPVLAPGKNCPTKYECVGLGKWTDKCYFKGKAYVDGESVNSSLSDLSCHESCFCNKQGSSAEFTCAILDCPEWLGARPPPGCYFTYDLKECCSIGKICGPPTAPSFPEDLAKCTVDGKEYREGEKFYPKGASCMDCVCLKNFKGEFEEPFCRRRSCGVQLDSLRTKVTNELCAPVYGKKGEIRCCARNWVCPDGSEEFQGAGTSEETCKYGDKTLKVGQTFQKLNLPNSFGPILAKVECECLIPPLVSCSEV